MSRKKKIKLYQILFLLIGITVAIFTFVKINEPNQKMIISKNTQKKLALAPLLKHEIKKNKISATHHQSYWSDIGTPERLKQINMKI